MSSSLLTKLTCGYLYDQLVVIQAAIDAVKELLLQSLNVINSLLDAELILIRDVINVAIDLMLDIIKALYDIVNNVIQSLLKKGTDLYSGKAFCKELFKCLAFVNSLLSDQYIQRLFNLTGTKDIEQEVMKLVNDFALFKDSICGNFNFSIDFGLAYCKKMTVKLKKMVNYFYDLIMRYKLKIRNQIESYMGTIDFSGILELIVKLSDLSTCLFSSDDENCTSLQTATNYAAMIKNKLCLTDTGTGDLMFYSPKYNSVMGQVEATTKKLDRMDKNLDKLTDILSAPLNVGASANAYSLNRSIRQIGTFVKNRDYKSFKKLDLVNYFSTNLDDLCKLYKNTFDSKDPDPDIVLRYTKTKDNSIVIEKDGITVKVPTTITTADLISVSSDTDTSMITNLVIDPNSKKVLQIAELAANLAKYELGENSDKMLYDYAHKAYSNMNDLISEEDLLKC